MPQNKFKVIFISALILIAGGTTGYILYDQIANNEVDVRIGYLEGDLHQLAYYVAQAQGFYADEGISVESTPFANGGDVMVAFEAIQRSIDMAYLGFAPALYHRFNNPAADIKIVGAANVNGSALIVKDDPTIQNATDLLGLTIAVPARHNMQDFILAMILDLAGYTHDNISIEIQNPSEMPLALETGDIDGYVAWEPHVVKGAVAGIGKYLYNSSQVWENHPCCVVGAHEEYIGEHNETIVRVLDAHITATEWIWNNPDDAIALAMDKMNLSENQARLAMTNIGYVYTPDINQMVTFVDKMIELNPGVFLDSENLPSSVTTSISFIDWFVDLSYLN